MLLLDSCLSEENLWLLEKGLVLEVAALVVFVLDLKHLELGRPCIFSLEASSYIASGVFFVSSQTTKES